MTIVETAVVATDNVKEVIITPLEISGEIQTGAITMTKFAMPVAEGRCQETSSSDDMDKPMEPTFKTSGTPANFQLQLQMIQQRQT
jgi:hypothetical protein